MALANGTGAKVQRPLATVVLGGLLTAALLTLLVLPAALNAADRKVTLDHGAIPAIKWPPMKMEFAVAPNVDLSKLTTTTGEKVDFTLSGSGSSYTVQSITPAK